MKKERDLSDVEINNISQEDTRMGNNPERLEMEDTGVCINCGWEMDINMAQCEHCGYCYPNFINVVSVRFSLINCFNSFIFFSFLFF